MRLHRAILASLTATTALMIGMAFAVPAAATPGGQPSWTWSSASGPPWSTSTANGTVQAARPRSCSALAPSQNRVNGMGTGIIIDPRGYIVTNQHVVEDVNVIRVRLADGTTDQRPGRGPRRRDRPGPAQDRRQPAAARSCRWAPPAT